MDGLDPFGKETDLIETWLPAVLDCIIDANSKPDWTDSSCITNANSIPNWTDGERASIRVALGHLSGQSDGHSCGIYTIFNALALVRQREPSLEQLNPRSLRVEYARALVKAV